MQYFRTLGSIIKNFKISAEGFLKNLLNRYKSGDAAIYIYYTSKYKSFARTVT